MSTSRVLIMAGGILGLLGVVAGAMGVHALRDTLDARALSTFETGVRFQMYHALALLAVGLLAGQWKTGIVKLSGVLFTVGVVLFSGSLYILAITGIGVFGAIAPLGGLSLMAAWTSLIVGAIRQRDPS
ncbi:MAG: hypothetical protein CL755_06545 [Chloroflexi bacterium]|nr:hypothetical protein [Chloroflexota bacterium]MCH2536547.1 DUF423 domain-containing protein [Dehalococcoidia bacterium]HIM47537.1 DUF423 domain-containing protein [Dehalococcoidia bacterium]